MKNRQRLVALALSGALVASSVPMVSASSFQDMPKDWSTTALENAVANGLLQGSNGKIMPDNNMTRAEMATIIARAFAADQLADISAFADVPEGAWYETSLAKAVQMGVLFGANGSLNPTDDITRQEAFCVLARAFALSPADSDAVDTFADGADVASWARSATSAMIEAGFVKGADNSINPTNNITRKEFATLMDRMVSQYFTEAGTFQAVSQGSVMINTPDVILKDVTIDGDLIVGDGVGDGDVTLDNVTVNGNVLVRGGGENTFRLLNNSSVKGQVSINKCSGKESTRLLGDSTIELPSINVLGASQGVVLEEVIVESVNVVVTKPQDESASTGDSTETPVVLKNASVDKIAVTSNKVALDTINSIIGVLTATGSDTTVNVDKNSTVSSAVVTGDNTAIAGKGKVTKIETSAANTVVEVVGSQVVAGDTATGTVVGDKEVAPGTTVAPPVKKPTSTAPTLKAFDPNILGAVEAYANHVVLVLDGEIDLSADDFEAIQVYIADYIRRAGEANAIDVTGLTVAVTATGSKELSATLTQSGYATASIPLKNMPVREYFTVTFDLNSGSLNDPSHATQVVAKGEPAVFLTEEDLSYIPPDETGKAKLFDQWVDANGNPVTELTVTETTTLYATYKEDPRTIAQQRIDKARTAINNNDPTPITVVDGEITKVGSFTVDSTSTTNDLDTLLKNEVSGLLTTAMARGVYSEVNETPTAPFTSASIRLVYIDDVTGEDSTVTNTIASLVLDPSESYTITFEVDSDRGAIASDRKCVVQKGQAVPVPTVTDRADDNFKFVGWKTGDSDDVIKLADIPVATATTTYTAVFKEQFTVTFDDNVADAQITVPEAQQITTGEEAEEPAAPTRENAIFEGWYTDEACIEANKFDFSTPITASMTLYAKWTLTSAGKVATTVDTRVFGDLTLTALEADANGIDKDSNAINIFNALGIISSTQLPLMDETGVLVADGEVQYALEIGWKSNTSSNTDETLTLTADFTTVYLPDGYSWAGDNAPTDVTITVTIEPHTIITGLTLPDEITNATLTETVAPVDGDTAITLAPRVFDAMGVDMPTTLLANTNGDPVDVEVTWAAVATNDGYQLTATADDTPSGYVFATNKNKLELGISISAERS